MTERDLKQSSNTARAQQLVAGVGFALLALAPAAWAQSNKGPCDVSSVKKELDAASPGLLTTFFSTPWDATRCSSLLSVMKLAGSTAKKGGRKLEGDKPLDVKAAEQERAAAKADPEFAKLLAIELKGETDPARALLREAALLDDDGKFKARDLLLQQLRAEKAK
jgi:hypothetical protein